MDEPDNVYSPETDKVLERVAERLAVRFVGNFSTETIIRYLRESYVALYRTARVKSHLHVLAERFANDRLTALAQAQGFIPKAVPEVLFVCTHNAGRSQMAAALLEHHANGKVGVRTAGSEPASDIEPTVVEALAEIGLDASAEFPKPLTDDVIRAADVIVTMGCGDACPIHPGKRYLDWTLPDPHGKPLDEVRAIRDQVDAHVRELLDELTLSTTR
ncbi:arsenate reductase ArsC [Planotetraspora kaengkrachanensis]|uniref:Low molecular weight phosphatase family protein n=1 Tax=Planotetraspora kaengkrachanensis TaxID=575193 RepID=A0A8J3VC72_9ACTN|nr:arsenate reductase ArsC [Planotetraspora kaengkrachanensis]GIG84224.1 low molecular weight phosphatase family protein [Planotetraspora kaengkrachanensis]